MTNIGKSLNPRAAAILTMVRAIASFAPRLLAADPMPAPSDKKLDARARQLLRALISQYIADGQPIGSRTLARHSGLDVSAATIRNVMADLEEIGLLAAPHTSAGRVPTAQGYRMFVDSLLELKPLDEPQIEQLRRELPTQVPTQDLLNGASSLLSDVTHFVGVVTVPKREEFPFRHIDFVALGGSRVLTILVFADNDVQNRVVTTQRAYSASELEQIANFLNANYAGLRMAEIRERLLREMRETSHNLNQLMAAAIDVTQHAFPDQAGPDMLVAGQINLMGSRGLSDMERLRELFEAFQRKRDLLLLLENCARAEGVRLFIGEESGFTALDGCSLITAPYGVEGRVLGVLGVIGPTRMAYQRVIPVVQATAQIVSNALNQAQQAT
jgi:heat-inducible transcriptional repressor